MATVELDQVRKAYGQTAVVKGLSLKVQAGEFIALLGPSGCGKTTTLRMIAGLERPDAGRLLIGGVTVDGPGAHVPPERRRLGMVFQSYAVWPHHSVFENVAYPLRLAGVARPDREARVRKALGWVRLEALADRRPHQLSGGQLQRVALARALVAEPSVLLLDEPLSNLDAGLREELRGEIAALRARLDVTMVYVTHDQSEALALADRVAVMNQGVLEQVAAPQQIYAEPATAFVAGFVGGANVIAGRVEAGRFLFGPHALTLPMSADDGPATLAVRPEDLVPGTAGTALELTARLFLGHATEYRFSLGQAVLRAVGPHLAVPPTAVTIKAARLFR